MADLAPVELDKDTLATVLDAELANCIGGVGTGNYGDDLLDEMQVALDRYYNRPLGDEEYGRSTAQSSDVQDTIEARLPGLLKPFISGENVVEFRPRGPEDEEQAKQQTETVNYVILNDNDGFRILRTWLKDALLQKNGHVCAEWQRWSEKKTAQQVVTLEQLQAFESDPEIELKAVSAVVNGEMLPLEALPELSPEIMYAVEFDYQESQGQVVIKNIPPEHFRISRNAVDIETARLVGWLERVTISELREEGYDDADLADLATADRSGQYSFDRGEDQGNYGQSTETQDPSTREVWRFVGFVRMDYDGDGIAELRRVVRAGCNSAGQGGTLLANEPCDGTPIFSTTLIPMPHQFYGRSLADLTVPLQDQTTALLRLKFDNLYQSVYNRWGVVTKPGSINENTLDDLVTGIPGGFVRMDDPNAVFPLPVVPDTGETIQMIEYMDRKREQRTGVSRNEVGIDPNVLNDKSATQSNIEANAAAEAKEYQLRIFAQDFAKVCKHVRDLLIKHQDTARWVRLRGQMVQVDPRTWNADMDVTTNVGLGTGTQDQRRNAIMMVLQEVKQAFALRAQGINLVDESKLHNALSQFVDTLGIGKSDLFFNDPSKPDPNGQPPQPQITPEMQAQQQAALQQAHAQGKQEGADQIKLAVEQMQQEGEDRRLAMKLAAEERIEAAKLQTQMMQPIRISPVTEGGYGN